MLTKVINIVLVSDVMSVYTICSCCLSVVYCQVIQCITLSVKYEINGVVLSFFVLFDGDLDVCGGIDVV